MPIELGIGKVVAALGTAGSLVLGVLGWAERRYRHLDRKIESRSMSETQEHRIGELEAGQQQLADRVERVQQSAVTRDDLDRHIASLQASIEGLGRQIDNLSNRLDHHVDKPGRERQ